MKFKRYACIAIAIILVMSAMSCGSLITQTNKHTGDELIITMGSLKIVLPTEQQKSLDIQKYRPVADKKTDAAVMVKQTWTSIDGEDFTPLTVGDRIPYPMK